jgi:hypothetical protein
MTEEKNKPQENVEESAPAPVEEETLLPQAEKSSAEPAVGSEAQEKAEPESTPEVPEEAEPPPEAAPPAEEPAAEETEEEPEEEEKKKKIRHLSLEEVEKNLARARIKMGGEASVYVKHLLARKRELEGNSDR